MGNFLKGLKVLKNHQSETQESIDNAVKNVKGGTRIIGLIGILFTIFSIIAICVTVSVGSEVSSTKTAIDNEFGPKYTDRKVFMAVDIQTANITGYANGLLETDLGVVRTDKKPKATVAIVFINLDGELQLIGEMERSNSLTAKTFEYVGRDYNPGASATLLTTEFDRVNYKDYTKEATKLAELESKLDVLTIVMILLLIVAVPSMVIAIIASEMIKKTGKVTFNAEEVLDASNIETNVEIERQGIGADGKQLEVENKSVEDAIASEGGTFTGKIK